MICMVSGASETEVYAVGDNGKISGYTGDIDGDGVLDATDNCWKYHPGPGQILIRWTRRCL